MKALIPFLKLWRKQFGLLLLGTLLAAITLLASVGLLTQSGWFLAAAAIAGSAGMVSFNYMLPSAGVRAAALLRTVARYLERLVSHDATFKMLQHLRVTLFKRLFPLAPVATQKFRQGDLLSRFVGDIELLDHLYLRVLSPWVGALLVIIIVTWGLGIMSLPLALINGAVMLATLVLLPPLCYRLGRPTGQQLARLSSHYRWQLTQWLGSMAELQIYPAHPLRQELAITEQRWIAAQQRQNTLQASAQAVVLLLSGLTMLGVLWLSSTLFREPGQDSANIALFIFSILAAFEALGPVANAFLPLSQVIFAAERLSELLDHPPTIQFPAQDSSKQWHSPVALRFEKLAFQYPGQSEWPLSALSLEIAAGQRLALLGVTGSGKSTLLQLITRAWQPSQGAIIFDQRPIAEWSEATLRRRITVVTQRVALFNQTLRDNLLLAAPEADDQQLIDALECTGLDKLLESPGLDGWLGEGGRQLSGGERRRLAIARALLHDGDLWLLDEPTEGLDAQTERQILTLLNQITQGKTLIMVTHRLTGLEQMDSIAILEDGQIVEQGDHGQLLQQRGRYWQFMQRQIWRDTGESTAANHP